ncbi:ribosome biogenesis regulatory protein-domain-containing protein [Tribonema minus]|uniref:Ribosome biogenesis regulatory protein-domain-containing protein n=1 Tax=Tribonema minus TaxID=303371 RepID=A0A836CG24_9STRA|nr:ribosome biogenesis regulatory protein-domain-containing protein [Tribonema minus]
MAVSAADIAPNAFSRSQDNSAEAEDMSFDLRNLVAFNPHAVDAASLGSTAEERERALMERARMGVQQLMAKLFTLPSEPSNVGPVAHLPAEEVTQVPREKPLPKPRAETKWEKFAKEKGIKAKKSSRMVWDEDHKEWRPNWGYKRGNDGVLDLPIVEHKSNADIMADPWTEARAAKKARVVKNLTQRAKNDMRSSGKNPMAGIPLDMMPAARGLAGSAGSRKRGRDSTRKALELAQASTASMGKFDSKRAGEPERKKGAGGVAAAARQKFKPLVVKGGAKTEGEGALKILNSVMINRDKRKNKSAVAAETKSNFVAYDAIEGNSSASNRKKKGRAAAGKATKVTKKRAKDPYASMSLLRCSQGARKLSAGQFAKAFKAGQWERNVTRTVICSSCAFTSSSHAAAAIRPLHTYSFRNEALKFNVSQVGSAQSGYGSRTDARGWEQRRGIRIDRQQQQNWPRSDLTIIEKALLGAAVVGIGFLAVSFGAMVLAILVPLVGALALFRYARNRITRNTYDVMRRTPPGTRGAYGPPSGGPFTSPSMLSELVDRMVAGSVGEALMRLQAAAEAIRQDVTAKLQNNAAAVKALGPGAKLDDPVQAQHEADPSGSRMRMVFPVAGTRGGGQVEVVASGDAAALETMSMRYHSVILRLRNGTTIDLTSSSTGVASGGAEPPIIEAEFREKR